MHVGLLIYGSLDTVSGGYLYDRKLVTHLRQRGDTVTVFSLPWRTYGRHLLDNLSRSLLASLADAPLDVLLQDELNHPSLAWLNTRLRQRADYPLCAIVHHLRIAERHPRPLLALYRRVERRYLASVDAFVFNSETTRHAVGALCPSARTRPNVVAYPAGDRFGRTSPPPPDTNHDAPLRIIVVGNLTPRKGIHTVLDAVRRLPDGQWQLDLVGSTTVAPRYVAALRSQLDHPAITVHGAVTDAVLSELLHSADVLALPSQYEGFGIVYLEAMGCGCVPIGSRSGAAHELITDGVNGYLVPPDDPGALAQRLQTVLHNRPHLLTMRNNALARFAAHPTWDETGTAIRAFLHNVTRAEPTPTPGRPT